MANYQTLKNSIKKLESKQTEDDQHQHCGVIYQDDYDKLMADYDKLEPSAHPADGVRRKVGYLVVPRPLTEEEWIAKYGIEETEYNLRQAKEGGE